MLTIPRASPPIAKNLEEARPGGFKAFQLVIPVILFGEQAVRQAVTVPDEVASPQFSPPKSKVIAPPTCLSTVVGVNHELIPGPVAIARHTYSGVPVWHRIAASTTR
jgi:hypothetical protein